MSTAEIIQFVHAREGEPTSTELLFGLAGACAALDRLTTYGAIDPDLIANLSSAVDALAKLLVHRMTNCPVGEQVTP